MNERSFMIKKTMTDVKVAAVDRSQEIFSGHSLN